MDRQSNKLAHFLPTIRNNSTRPNKTNEWREKITMKTKLTLSIDSDLARAGSIWAFAQGITLSSIYEDAIRHHLESDASPELKAWIESTKPKK